ncbi:MAG: glycosyltransferase [Phycisphaerae bacterium]|nr:glycosyltransferase [Phycisphaerae bacterium]
MSDPFGVSFVIATYNRRNVLLETLGRLADCGLDRSKMQTIVVNNASDDGTAVAICEHFPDVDILALSENRGPSAKALALPETRFRYTVFLDDDSWPLGDSVTRMIDHFERTPSLAAAGFIAHLPSGQIECSALPGVFIGCGVGLRTEALRKVGSYDERFFMAAEEYDLAFRLANAGYLVRDFDDLHVRHLKAPQARYRGTLAYYDTRNNLVVACRYLTGRWLRVYLADWIQRYAWLSSSSGNGGAFARGLAAGLWWAACERLAGREEPLSPRAFERFFRVQEIEYRMRDLRDAGVRRIILASLGKNVFAFRHGAEQAGIELIAIADDGFGSIENRRYRGTPIVPTVEAMRMDFHAVVVSNTSFAHAYQARGRLASMTDRPIHDWFGRWPEP